MKKLFSVLLALCMLLSMLALVSCKKQTTAERVNEAIAATYAADSYAAKYDMSISMETMGMTVDVPTTMDMKVKNATSDNPTAMIDMTMEMFGMEIDVSMYMEDGWMYTSAMGETYKTRVTDADDYTENVNDMLQELPEDYLKTAEVKRNLDGSETVIVVLPNDAFSEIFSDTIASAAASAADSIDGVEVSNTRIEMTIKNGMIYLYSMSFDMAMQTSGVDVVAKTKTDMTFTAFGDDVVITPPAGYQNYPEQ